MESVLVYNNKYNKQTQARHPPKDLIDVMDKRVCCTVKGSLVASKGHGNKHVVHHKVNHVL